MIISRTATPKLYLARELALYAHQGQTRKDGSMYFEHLCRVMAIVELMTGAACTEDMLITALLHDLLEDTEVDQDTIWNLFGDEVLTNVIWLTKETDETRKGYIAQLIENGSDTVIIVKIADNKDNMSDPNGVLKPKHVERYAAERKKLMFEAGRRSLPISV